MTFLRKTLIALCLVSLTACQTIKVQGVEITKENQRWALLGAITAAVIAHQLKDDNDVRDEKCLRYLNVPTGKGDFICEVY